MNPLNQTFLLPSFFLGRFLVFNKSQTQPATNINTRRPVETYMMMLVTSRWPKPFLEPYSVISVLEFSSHSGTSSKNSSPPRCSFTLFLTHKIAEGEAPLADIPTYCFLNARTNWNFSCVVVIKLFTAMKNYFLYSISFILQVLDETFFGIVLDL